MEELPLNDLPLLLFRLLSEKDDFCRKACDTFMRLKLCNHESEKLSIGLSTMFQVRKIEDGTLFRRYYALLDTIGLSSSILKDSNHLCLLIQAFPDFLSERDDNGNTFLHFFLRHISIHSTVSPDLRDRLSTLLDVMRGSSAHNAWMVRNNRGSLPMHYLILGKSDWTHASLVIRQLFIMINEHNCLFRVILTVPSPEFDGQSTITLVIIRAITILFETAKAMDGIAWELNSSEDDRSLGSPAKFARMLLWYLRVFQQHMPGCLETVDNLGYTPLFRLMSECKILKNWHPDPFSRRSKDISLTNVLRMFLSRPVALTATKKGILPIHFLSKSCHPLIQVALSIAPEAVEQMCPESRMYPFQRVAAIQATPNTTTRRQTFEIEMIFRMLQSAPQLVSTALSDKTSAHYLATENYNEGTVRQRQRAFGEIRNPELPNISPINKRPKFASTKLCS